MISASVWLRRLRCFKSPLLVLLALLQRTPVLRCAAIAGEVMVDSPFGTVLRSALAPLAALGTLDSLAGATTVTNNTPTGVSYSYGLVTTPAHPSPATVQVGTPVAVTMALSSTPAQPAPQSWAIAGPMPPGLVFGSGSNTVSGLSAGMAQGINTANPVLSGTPTQPGDYKMQLQAYQFQNGQGFFSSVLTYEVIVTAGNAAPSFITQPQNQTVTAGSPVSFSVAVAGNPVPTLQWTRNGAAIAGATDGTLSISSVSAADAGTYACVATNAQGTSTSAAAVLSVTAVLTAPAFSFQPAAQTVVAGTTVALNAVATGAPAPTYQWTFNGTPILGATGSTLVMANAAAANGGSYACVATNAAGTATSSAAVLSLTTTPDVGRLVNISCRAGVGTGANVLIVGFVSGGAGTTGTQPVLIRATGPALVPFGVAGTLPDPQLALYGGSSLLATNAGWKGNAQITAADTAVGAFPLTSTTAADSALYVPALVPGGYSAQIAGATGDTGVALAEVYDATPAGGYTAAAPRIINISARTQVGTGSNVLIAGFTIGGSTSKTVLVRASGPALAAFGVAGTLADPQLTLFRGPTVIATNGGWAGNPAVAGAAAAVNAFPWSDGASRDSALLLTLPPGSYSAEVAGAGGAAADTGVALVEVYEVP